MDRIDITPEQVRRGQQEAEAQVLAMPDYTITKRSRKLWSTFVEWYGKRSVAEIGGIIPRDWCEVVDSIKTRDVWNRVLQTVKEKHLKYPPKFPEFDAIVSACANPPPVNVGPSAQDQLTNFVLRTKSLTANQLRMPWEFFGKGFDAADASGKMKSNFGREVTGVIVPADGDAPGYRVTVEDMRAAS